MRRPQSCRQSLASLSILLLVTAGTFAVAPRTRYVHFVEARPILTELSAILPPELNTLNDLQREAAWPAWIEKHDREIRARLVQGDEDTIVNWLLWGTSFTSRPPASPGAVAGDATRGDQVSRQEADLIASRLDDLVRALTAPPGTDERRLFARGLLARKGLHFNTVRSRAAVREYLRTAILRVTHEREQLDRALSTTKRADDSIAEFVLRSRLFRTRGLSLDTSLLPDYALEQSLAAMKTRGLLRTGGIRRVGIIGPGLDFADKNAGFDFYPPQTLQPFALLESLRRLDLGPSPVNPEVVVLDISPRVIDHVARARTRAVKGDGYTLYLPLARSTQWLPDLRKYWETFGDRIGTPVGAPSSKAIEDRAELRAVRVPPSAVQRLSPVNLNVVTQRLDGEKFDLLIATNVFVYYDELDQALAMANVDAMLKPGGFLLANFAAPELASLHIHSVDSLATLYSRADDVDYSFDYIVWYEAHGNP